MLNIFVIMNYAMETKKWLLPEVCEYKLVLEPGKNIKTKVQAELEDANIQHEKSEVGIPLGSFLAKEQMEVTLIRWIQKICNLQGRFELTLNNYGGRPPHQVHIRIQDQSEIKKMINQLKMIDHFIQANDCPPAILPASPQMEFINNLPEHLYYKVLNKFASRSFHETFTAEKICLYKRAGITSPFMLVNSFALPTSSRY